MAVAAALAGSLLVFTPFFAAGISLYFNKSSSPPRNKAASNVLQYVNQKNSAGIPSFPTLPLQCSTSTLCLISDATQRA